MPAASEFADYHDAVDFQNSRLFGHQLGHQAPSDSWGAMAQRFRMDPRRDLDANLQVIASYLRPDDVFIDVGGGAGRVSLPLAQSCREVVAVEPSPGMGAEFDASRMDAGIGNASRVQAEWMDADGIEGDVVFAGCVTYFVRDIVPFVEKLQASARRRVIVTLWSEPPACSAGPLFDLVYGEPQEPLPGYRQLMSVLWEMDILPDLLVLPDAPWWENASHASREDALVWALEGSWFRPEDRERASGILEDSFDRLFISGQDGFRPRWKRTLRELLITWETT